MRRAFGLPLMPVPHVVCADHAERSGHADQRPEPDEQALQPNRRLEAAVDQKPVHPHRMARKQCHNRQEQKDDQAAETGEEHQSGQPSGHMRKEPERLGRCPNDATFRGGGLSGGDHAVRINQALHLVPPHLKN
jgi:hypothetical protein